VVGWNTKKYVTEMEKTIAAYNKAQTGIDGEICSRLMEIINQHLPKAESKIWHAHPVWFLDRNPIVGYSKIKAGIRLMFWSGVSFDEDMLAPGSGKFKDASFIYTGMEQIKLSDLKRWLDKAQKIQWDYKNIVKRKGELLRLK
jgi:hypothetical protein